MLVVENVCTMYKIRTQTGNLFSIICMRYFLNLNFFTNTTGHCYLMRNTNSFQKIYFIRFYQVSLFKSVLVPFSIFFYLRNILFITFTLWKITARFNVIIKLSQLLGDRVEIKSLLMRTHDGADRVQ